MAGSLFPDPRVPITKHLPPPQPGPTSAPRHCAGLPCHRWLLSFDCYRNLLWEQRVRRSSHLPFDVLSQRPWGYLRVLCLQDTHFVKKGTITCIRHRKLIAHLLVLLQHLHISSGLCCAEAWRPTSCDVPRMTILHWHKSSELTNSNRTTTRNGSMLTVTTDQQEAAWWGWCCASHPSPSLTQVSL